MLRHCQCIFAKQSKERILSVAQKMRSADSSGEVPVPSFVYELLKEKPALRNLNMEDRMTILLDHWDQLSVEQRMAYAKNPLKGIIDVD